MKEGNRYSTSMNIGGGVGLWVRDDIDFETFKSPFETKEIETQTVLLPGHNLAIINVYRPFGDKNTFIAKCMGHIDSIIAKYPGIQLTVAGDFNLDLSNPDEFTETLIEQTIARGMLQQVTNFTRTTDKCRSLIDHVYTRSKHRSFTDIILADISDHNLLLTQFQNWSLKQSKIKITKRWFDKDSYTNIHTLLGAEDWTCMEGMDVNNSTDHLISRITEAMDIVAPVETKEVKLQTVNPWLTQGLTISLKASRKMYKRNKKNKDSAGWLEYKKYKKVLDSH